MASVADSVPDAVAPPPRHPRFPLVDGMRAIAVLGVLVVHAAVAGDAVSSSIGGRLLAHLNVGVTIFFLISGFLLYRPFIAHRVGGAPPPRVGDYFKRRFLRIFPAYWLILTVLIVVPGLTAVIEGNWWPMYALTHALPANDGRGCIDAPFDCGLAHTWSLVVEATFYAVLPLYVIVADRLTRGLERHRWALGQLGLLGLAAALSMVLQYVVLDPAPRWVTGSAIGYVLWFALGMGMAVVSASLGAGADRPRPRRRAGAPPELAWLAALALYGLLCARLPATTFLLAESDKLEAYVGFGAVAALLLAPAVFGDPARGLPRRFLALPVVAWLGLVSYGIFLWHYVVTLELGREGAGGSFGVVLLGTFAITTAIAALSYYALERPLLRLKYVRLAGVVRARAAPAPE